MIEAISLTKKFGPLTAIEGVSFRICPGEVVGLLGPNGAGKTTTIRLLTGFMPPTSGKVIVGGSDLLESPREAKEKLGYLPENPPLYPELTVEESLSFVAGLRGPRMPEKSRQEKIEKAMEKTGIAHVRRRLIGHISKGYRQRVGIAQAILHEPPYLILDEPTIGLDPKQILEIREMIQGFKGERAILLSSHILQEISIVCDRVIIIHRGRIVADGKIGDLIGPLKRKRFLVTVSGSGDGESGKVRTEIGKLPGVEEVSDYSQDLEDLFLKLTEGEQH